MLTQVGRSAPNLKQLVIFVRAGIHLELAGLASVWDIQERGPYLRVV